MDLLSKRAEVYNVSPQVFEQWINRGAPVGSEKQMVTWLSQQQRKMPRVKSWLKSQGVKVDDRKKIKPTEPLDCAEAFRNYYARKLEEAINDDDHCLIKFWSNLFIEVDESIRRLEVKSGRIKHKETLKEKKAEAYKNINRTLKRGDTREDGMVFDCYNANLFNTNFEQWVTAKTLADRQKKAKDSFDNRNPPTDRVLEIRKKKEELSTEDFIEWNRSTRQSVIKKKTCPIEKRKAADRAAKIYKEIKADPIRLAAHRRTKKKSQSNRYNKKLKHCPLAKLERSVRSRLSKRMKSKGTKFTKNFDDLIGCTPAFLQAHIESQFNRSMTWDNWGSYWHLDHIRPISSFDLAIQKEYLAANHYTNLQPLEATKNIKKSNEWDGQTDMLSELL